jgi:hypothetical protein
MLTLLLMPLADLHFCVGLDFVTSPLKSFLSKHHHHHESYVYILNNVHKQHHFRYSTYRGEVLLRRIYRDRKFENVRSRTYDHDISAHFLGTQPRFSLISVTFAIEHIFQF